jgi:phosphate transport system protein
MRTAYHDQLDAIIDDLIRLTGMVQEATSQASVSLLQADEAVAQRVIAGDRAIDMLRDDIESRAFELLALQQPVAGDLRMLVAAVRMVADLERMGDLAVHVAKVAQLRVPDVAVPPDLLPIMRRMSDVAIHMIGSVADVIANRDVDAARSVERDDEEMDELRRRQFRMMLGDSWSYGVEPAIDNALLGRYFERIADHAVSLARRVVYLVTGETPTPIDV